MYVDGYIVLFMYAMQFIEFLKWNKKGVGKLPPGVWVISHI